MDIFICIMTIVCMAGVLLCVFRLWQLNKERIACNNRIHVLGCIDTNCKNGKCEICGKESGFVDGGKAVRITREPYIKVLCPYCAATHNFYPVYIESEDRDEAVYGIDYVVWPPKQNDEHPYLKRIK